MALSRDDYTVAWISALPDELTSAQAFLEEEHKDLPAVPGDHNVYSLGRIGEHNVVIAGLPRGSNGTTSATTVATNLLRSFQNVRFGLMVGVGGGVPHVVRLGDIVVSSPAGQTGGVIQYDLGTGVQDGTFIRKGTLPGPPTFISTAITKLSATAKRKGYKFDAYLKEILQEYPRLVDSKRPDDDVLYNRSYIHPGLKADCSQCDPAMIVRRSEAHSESTVHYGVIGSGNTILRDAIQRDDLYEREGIICFEMEAAGLMKDFPCVVIRGICDYCDTHKNKHWHWQPYAGAIAAAYAKELLMTIPPHAVADMPTNRLLAAVEAQTNEMKALHVTEQSAHVTAKDAHATIQSIDARFSAVENRAISQDDRECLRALNATDPQLDKKRLEDLKGGLLKDSYKWILRNEEFLKWRASGKLLWIKGDPGKGKTMLMCGIIDEMDNPPIYFFCEATNSLNSSASAVLRGLIYALIAQNPSRIVSVRDKLLRLEHMLDPNVWYTLADILEELIRDQPVTIFVDGLDECKQGRDNLLRLIVKISSSTGAKWIVSSRNHQDIEDVLTLSFKLSLELNEQAIADAVANYIDYKTLELAKKNDWTDDLKTFVWNYFHSHAQSTFLWVALICDSLATTQPWDTKAVVTSFPSGLEEVYSRMLSIIEDSGTSRELSKCLLAVISTVYIPVSLAELQSIMELPDGMHNPAWLARGIANCGSFIAVRNEIVGFVHETAKDFVQREILDLTNSIATHHRIYQQSLLSLQKILRRHIYNLKHPDATVSDALVPQPDPLASVRYSCLYWFDHWNSSKLSPNTSMLYFLRSSFLYWLEAMCLLCGLNRAISIVRRLGKRLDMNQTQELYDFVEDASQFCLRFRDGIQGTPLQLYFSGLLFAPEGSIVRSTFLADIPNNVETVSNTQQGWISNENEAIDFSVSRYGAQCLAFDRNGTWIAIAYHNGDLTVYDTETGTIVAFLSGSFASQYVGTETSLIPSITSIAFQQDKTVVVGYLVIVNVIFLWNFVDNAIETRALGSELSSSHGLISPQGKYVAFTSSEGQIGIHEVSSGNTNLVSPHTSDDIKLLRFSPDEAFVTVPIFQGNVAGNMIVFHIWNTKDGSLYHTLEISEASMISFDLGPLAGHLTVYSRCDVHFYQIASKTKELRKVLEVSYDANRTQIYHLDSTLSGTIVVWTNYAVQIYEISDEVHCEELVHAHRAGIVTMSAISSQGYKLAYATSDRCNVHLLKYHGRQRLSKDRFYEKEASPRLHSWSRIEQMNAKAKIEGRKYLIRAREITNDDYRKDSFIGMISTRRNILFVEGVDLTKLRIWMYQDRDGLMRPIAFVHRTLYYLHHWMHESSINSWSIDPNGCAIAFWRKSGLWMMTLNSEVEVHLLANTKLSFRRMTTPVGLAVVPSLLLLSQVITMPMIRRI